MFCSRHAVVQIFVSFVVVLVVASANCCGEYLFRFLVRRPIFLGRTKRLEQSTTSRACTLQHHQAIQDTYYHALRILLNNVSKARLSIFKIVASSCPAFHLYLDKRVSRCLPHISQQHRWTAQWSVYVNPGLQRSWTTFHQGLTSQSFSDDRSGEEDKVGASRRPRTMAPHRQHPRREQAYPFL